jgi:hypothetical protein
MPRKAPRRRLTPTSRRAGPNGRWRGCWAWNGSGRRSQPPPQRVAGTDSRSLPPRRVRSREVSGDCRSPVHQPRSGCTADHHQRRLHRRTPSVTRATPFELRIQSTMACRVLDPIFPVWGFHHLTSLTCSLPPPPLKRTCVTITIALALLSMSRRRGRASQMPAAPWAEPTAAISGCLCMP